MVKCVINNSDCNQGRQAVELFKENRVFLNLCPFHQVDYAKQSGIVSVNIEEKHKPAHYEKFLKKHNVRTLTRNN